MYIKNLKIINFRKIENIDIELNKNINVFINESSFDYEMIINNDGVKPNKKIVEGEGIKGMKRKVYSLGGVIDISSRDGFVLKVRIKK